MELVHSNYLRVSLMKLKMRERDRKKKEMGQEGREKQEGKKKAF